MAAFDADRGEVLARAAAGGITECLVVSAERGDEPAIAAFARAHPGVRAAVGLHPHEASAWGGETAVRIAAAADDPLVVAVGEIGLDFHYDRSPRPAQETAFREQIRLARSVSRPIVVHSRSASEQTLRILEEERAGEAGGILHCFSETTEVARRAVALGFLISFSGLLTFPAAGALREAAAAVPPERLLVETDAPYLTPVPLRGRRNEPLYVSHTVALLARLHGLPAEEMARITAENFRSLFGSDPRGPIQTA